MNCIRARRRFFYAFFLVALSQLLAPSFHGMTSADARSGSRAAVVVQVELLGPDDTYPLEHAVVRFGGEQQRTDAAGLALFEDVAAGVEYVVRVETAFGDVAERRLIDGNTYWNVPVPLPAQVSDDEFRRILFDGDGDNRRWPWGAVIRVHFDYSRAPRLSPEERAAAEAVARREFEGWFESFAGAVSPLRWGGAVGDPEDANVIVHMMHDDAYYERFPDDAGTMTAGRGGWRVPGGDRYIDRGEVWIRVDCCATSNPGLYAHELGHALGFYHPDPGTPARSVMGQGRAGADAVGPVDSALAGLKMHLPALLPYDRTALGERSVDPRVAAPWALVGAIDGRGPVVPWRRVDFAYGRLTDEDGQPLAGIAVVDDGGRPVATTDAFGRWYVGGREGPVTLGPVSERWAFSPAARTFGDAAPRGDFVGRRLGASVEVAVALQGVEYPLEHALVEVGDRRGRTDAAGRVVLHHLTLDERHPVTVTTDFGRFAYGALIVGDDFPLDTPLELSVPSPVGPELLQEGVLAGTGQNSRWSRGATISVFFNYDEAEAMALPERLEAEQHWLDALAAWIGAPDGEDPHLRWVGRASDPEEAAVVVAFMSEEAFFSAFEGTPEHVSFRTRRWVRDGGTNVRGEVFFRHACCGHGAGTYAQAAGQIFGLGWLSPGHGAASVMAPGGADVPTDVDRSMLRLKMHLPTDLSPPGAENPT